VPDRRRHRGPAPRDTELFAPEQGRALRGATSDLSWLYGRGYAEDAALKLVGDRYALVARQRKAVERCACSDADRERRRRKRLRADAVAVRPVTIDGFNCIILCESVLSGAPVFHGRDGALRDLASVHGTWRRVSETARAIEALGALLAEAAPSSVRWLLDRPVSNSGRLASMLREHAEQAGSPWEVELVEGVDAQLADADAVVASADSWVLDRCRAWIDLPRAVLERHAPDAWLVDLA